MESVVKIAAVAIIAALCAVVIKKQVPEMGLVLGLLAGALILSFSMPALKSIKELMETLADAAGLSPAVLTPVVKTVGIGHSDEINGGSMPGRQRGWDRRLCRDGGRGRRAVRMPSSHGCGAVP